MKIICAFLILHAFISTGASDTVRYGNVRNGNFGSAHQYRPDDKEIVSAKDKGWELPDGLVLPKWWIPNPATGNGIVKYYRSGGWKDSAYIKLDGSGHLASYFGRPEPSRAYIARIQARGAGELSLGVYCYAGGCFMDSIPVIRKQIDANKWVEYRGIFANNRTDITGINLYLAGKGHVDIGEVDFFPADAADLEITREYIKLYGTGGWIENLETEAIKADDAFGKKMEEYTAAVKIFRGQKDKINQELYESLEAKTAQLEPYIVGQEKKLVLSASYNDMIVLTRVLNRITGGAEDKVAKSDVTVAEGDKEYYPLGYREPVPDSITITDVRSNKVRYDENERATTTATIANTTGSGQKGTLIARMHLDLDAVREISRSDFTVPAGQTKQWRFSYNVGPETYGRGIEVQFVDGEGRIVDRWQEFYAVAAEWFRVQQHAYMGQMKSHKIDPWTTYYNQRHHFASEPTDWGVQAEWCEDIEQYHASQPLYHLNMPRRRAEYAHFRRQGVMGTFYQTFAYAGQMGYEVIRQHPEFSLYSPNGQFAVDPVYGGSPNPMELASPIEIGPKRKVTKPYLDRKILSWQHNPLNYAREDVIIFMAESIKKQAEFLNCDGIYVDGNLGIWAGYGYDGKPNVPSDSYKDYVKLSARNHRLFSEILKKDNPNFGTWFNWAWGAVEHYVKQRGLTFYLGSGADDKVDPSDAAIRAAADWKNVMFLIEIQSGAFRPPYKRPADMFDLLLTNRDYIIQPYRTSAIMGYMFAPLLTDARGPTRWGWPTVNYFGAQLIASQHHFAGGFYPSLRPTLQFMTRYSRFIWAPDIKVVPEAAAEKMVKVDSAEKVWWKRLVYRRETKEGYDLIIHLVRIPPYEKFDIKWLDDPTVLNDARIIVQPGTGTVKEVYAIRPYFYEEEQQPVHIRLEPAVSGNKTTVAVPPFRYHTMIVMRIKK